MPIYNDAEFLRESLDSLINQSLENIEIICINDASTDNSLEIINEYSAKDSRVRVINRLKNGGALVARKNGVAAATGDFIMFLDGDDYFTEDACETAYELIKKSNVDILCFSLAINDHPEQEDHKNFRVVDLEEITLYGRKQIQNYYILGKRLDSWTSWSLVNKIYRTELLKTIYSKTDDFSCLRGEDKYLMYYILYYTSKIKNIVTEPLYIYCDRRGFHSNKEISLETFENISHQISLSWSIIRKFLELDGTFEEQQPYFSAWRQISIGENCSYCLMFINQNDYDDAVKILHQYWNEKDDAEEISKYFLTELCSNANRADKLNKLLERKKNHFEFYRSELEWAWSYRGALKILIGKVENICSKFHKFLKKGKDKK